MGLVAGYQGGAVGDVLMRLTEFFQVLPRFFVAVLAVALFGAGLDRLVQVLGFTSWAILARVVRAEVLSLRGRGFVEAAVALGASDRHILRRAILPNAMPPLIVFLTLLLLQVLLLEASLGFLGLSDPNAISWGYLANQAQRFLRIAWWMWLLPGVAIMVAVLALNLLGDALTRDNLRTSLIGAPAPERLCRQTGHFRCRTPSIRTGTSPSITTSTKSTSTPKGSSRG